ncbi:MAG: MBG domain-containing protein, partial [Anaerolineales bacterium]
QALLTVSPSPINPSVQYSDASPAISPSITGFVNGETASVLTKQPTCTTTRKVTDPAGSYPITCSGGQATNYSFLYVAGGLTITQEDAYLQYSGDSLAQTNTNLNLRVTVWDSAAVGYPSTAANPESKPNVTIGDITKMWIQFNIFPENTCGTSTTIAPLYAQVSDAPTIGDGIGTASATYKSTTEASYCVIARLVASKTGGVNQYYTAPDTESAAISFYQNSGRFASGDGWITDPNGQPGSFGFFSRFDSKGNPFGQLVYVYRGTYNGIPAVFIIRSNSLTALQISGTIYPLTATLQGKCTIQVIRAFGGAALYSDTAATFKAVAVDTNKNPATKSDSFALTVWDKKGVVYKTVLTSLLSQGDIVIHLK